jgi:hypothetical protein
MKPLIDISSGAKVYIVFNGKFLSVLAVCLTLLVLFFYDEPSLKDGVFLWLARGK